MSQQLEDLVAFLNREAEALAALQPPLTKAALRGHIRDRLGEAFVFPLAVRVRALVAGERDEGGRCLEVVPEGLTRDAASLIGPILVPTTRPLQAGSVVTIEAVLEDPRGEAPAQPGLRAKVTRLDAQVAVEP